MKALSGGGPPAAVLTLAVLSLAAVPATRADEGGAFHCALTEARGVAEVDALTVARLVCEELKRASSGRGRFGIGLETLGQVVLVTAVREDTGASVSVRLDGVEETPVAAGRIADALVHGLAFPATQRVDNLLEDETKAAKAKKGALKFSLGVADLESLGHGARSAGFSIGLLYATPRFALPAEMRLAWDDSTGGEPGLDLFSISVGGRAYLSRRDTSPFVGAGLGILWLHGTDGADPWSGGGGAGYFDADRFGLVPYVEAGVEMLRFHRGRIALHLRADLPPWSLESPGYEAYPYWDGRGPQPAPDVVVPAESRYVVPVAIGLTVAF